MKLFDILYEGEELDKKKADKKMLDKKKKQKNDWFDDDELTADEQKRLDMKECCEEVWVDEDGEILSEGTVRQYQRQGQSMVKKFRCLAGPKKGKLVSNASDCSKRKDPKKVRQGRKTMRAKKGVIQRKGRVAKNKAMSKLVTKMNQRLMGT